MPRTVIPLPQSLNTKHSKNELFFTCYFKALPKRIKPGSKIYTLVLHERSAQTGLVERLGTPNGELTLPSFGYKCLITNYSTTPVCNINISFKLIFKEVVEDHYHPGQVYDKIKKTTKCSISIAAINPGAENSFTYYTYSISSRYSMLSVPTTATIERVGSDQIEEIRLAQPPDHVEGSWMSFSPVTPALEQPPVARLLSWWQNRR